MMIFDTVGCLGTERRKTYRIIKEAFFAGSYFRMDVKTLPAVHIVYGSGQGFFVVRCILLVLAGMWVEKANGKLGQTGL